MPNDTVYRFSRFEVNPKTRQLFVEGRLAELGVRAFDLLLALIERRGRLVSKNELLDLVWPGLVVEENNLQVQVSTLRKVLGTHAITTVPGRGYQFTANLEDETARSLPKARKHNLPQALTSFVGREVELTEHTRALEQARLLTLTGIGGSGKTRLAIKLGERSLPAYPDGVWFVDLASIVDPEHVPFAIANTLAIRETPGKTIEETLCDRLADRHILLIYDNCEHLLDASARLAERLLQAVAGLRILATSRECLGLPGERVLPIRPLRAPSPDTDNDVSAVAECESVQLFVERARLVLPSFTLDTGNARCVADLCRRLDGIPLAIELAAALVKVLSVEQIRSQLGDRFRLLVGGARALPRHQTLRAVLQWSYEHLDSDERDLIRLLSVFAGGCTLHAAAAVADSRPNAPALVLVLGRLVDKSLVMVEHQPTGEPRYRLLETVRQYAAEQLDEANEGDRARTQHLAYYLRLAAEVDELVRSSRGRMTPFVARLDHELDNILAAHAWCDHVKDGATLGLQLANAVRGYWVERRFTAGLASPDNDPLALGYQLMLQALARPGAEARTMYRCRSLFGLSQLSFLMGRFDEAQAHLIESTALARALGDDWILAGRLGVMAYLDLHRNDLVAAKARAEEALLVARRSRDQHMVAGAFQSLGEVSIAQGAWAEADAYLTQSLVLARESSPPMSVADILIERSWVDAWHGNQAGALEALREAAPVIDEFKDMRRGSPIVSAVANLAASCKAYESAARLCGAARAFAESMILPEEEAHLARVVETLKQCMDDSVYTANEAAGRRLAYLEALAEARTWLDNAKACQ